MPSEESSILCVSRKWPSAACPANLCAYRVVPSFVADLVMSLLQVMPPALAQPFLPARFPQAQAIVSTPEESYDKASLFRGRKSRRRAACCKTSARRATSVRQDRRCRGLRAIPDNPGRSVLPSAAGWRFLRTAEKTVLPGGRREPRKRQWFAPPQHVEE